MSASFECPRCLTVFEQDAAEQTFAECPQCGSLAVPRGEMSDESDAVDDVANAGALGGGAADTQVGPPPKAAMPMPLDSGVFHALLGDSPELELPPGALRSLPDGEPVLEGYSATVEGSALAGGPTIAETPSFSDDVALTHDTDSHDTALASNAQFLQPSMMTQKPSDTSNAEALPPSVALTRSLEGSAIQESDAGAQDLSSFDAGATRTYDADPAALFGAAEARDEASDDFDPFKGIDLPDGGESVDLALGAAETPASETPTAETTSGFTEEQGLPPELSLSDPSLVDPNLSDPSLSASAGAAGEERTLVGPAPSSLNLEARAVTLSELEAQLPEGTPLDLFNPLAGADLFGAESFGDLEKAFDTAASSPDSYPETYQGALSSLQQDATFTGETPFGGTRSAEELVDEAIARDQADHQAHDDQAFDGHASEQAGNGVAGAPRPPGGPTAPPLRLRKATRVPHLSLSPEAIEAAALPITAAEISGRHARLPDRFDQADPPAGNPALFEATDVVIRPQKDPATVARAQGTGAADDDDEQEAVSQKAAVQPLGEERGLFSDYFSGFTLVRVALAAFLFGLVGTGIGVAVAPSDDDKPKTKLDRAREIFAKGNRFYEEGRFDDALGDYRGALAIDPTFTPAMKAKGAALAKQRRYKEAARAYQEYLEREPEAYDASQVEEVLARYRGEDDP